ncbi:MAG: glycosyltransferase family 39 protein [Planctomycetes bacterium]|nr:glycosyltransferase family 39 protein [Planctomycetota bacterium]
MTSTPQTSAPWWKNPPLLGLLALALCLRLVGYGESVWFDELFTSKLRIGDPILLAKTLANDIHPPLYFVFIYAWNAVFGDGEIWLRLPALIAGLASIVVLFRLAENWTDRRVAWVAAGMMALSPVHIWYSQEGRPYSLNLLLMLVTLLAFQKLMGGEATRRWRWTYALCLFGVVFTHYYMATFLFVLPVLARFARSTEFKRIAITSGVLLFLLAVYIVPKAYFSSVPTGSQHLRAFTLPEAWKLLFNWFWLGNTLTPKGGTPLFGTFLPIALQLAGALAFLRGAYVLLTRFAKGNAWQVLLLLVTLPAFLFLLPLLGRDATYIERSALPSLPFFLIVMATGFASFRNAIPMRRGVAIGGLIGVFALASYFAQRDEWTIYKPNPGWREATAYIKQHKGPGVERLYTEYMTPSALTYYETTFREAKVLAGNDDKIERAISRLEGMLGTEGLGGAITGFARGLIEDFQKKSEEYRRNMTLEIHGTDYQDPLNLPEGVEPAPEFWGLRLRHEPQPDPKKTMQRLIDDPSLEVIDHQKFRVMEVFRFRRVASEESTRRSVASEE